ncbi:hypothetical protein H5410_004951 [Solanum commersonii]|uniref:Uncharacterized protein n=1 Tax=Solanum commersonii TaxID=4109 RepID=A0A9J6A5A3_SOLCO|nr:hypothetical protein H5410_004951 [Solanum commersonii]
MAFKNINDVSYKDSISKSQTTLGTAISRGNIASMMSNELSQPSFNFDESKNSTNSSISTKVNTLMVDATN